MKPTDRFIDLLYYYDYNPVIIEYFNSLEVKPGIVYSKTVCNLFFHANAVTLYPNIYIYSIYNIRKELLTHELIHWFQQKNTEHFYLAYFIELLMNGYKRNKFEQEAYYFEDNSDYLLKFIN